MPKACSNVSVRSAPQVFSDDLCRCSSSRFRVALWLDEPFVPVGETVAAAVRKAALMLEAAVAIADESGRFGGFIGGSLGGMRGPLPMRSSAPAGLIRPATNWPPANTIF